MLAGRRSSRALAPRARASVVETGEMPEALARPNHELWDRAHRPPVLPRPPVRRRVGTDLRRPSRGNSGGRRALSRARAQLGRPRHTQLVRGASQPHLQRGPRGGLVQPEEAACTLRPDVAVPASLRQQVAPGGKTADVRCMATPNQGVVLRAWGDPRGQSDLPTQRERRLATRSWTPGRRRG